MQVSYSNSSALSSEHYRLVQALEESQSSAQSARVLVEQLTRLQNRIQKGKNTASSTRHDLLLALYCRSQRSEKLTKEHDELFSLSWCLPAAVKLAGSSIGGIQDRAIGYRFCDEVLTVNANPLKLLLINTIRSDLHTPSDSPACLQNWTLGLRAAASRRLACVELVPAIVDQVADLWETSANPAHIRQLAVAALLNLCSITDASSPYDKALSGPTHESMLHAIGTAARKAPAPFMRVHRATNTAFNVMTRRRDRTRPSQGAKPPADGSSSSASARALSSPRGRCDMRSQRGQTDDGDDDPRVLSTLIDALSSSVLRLHEIGGVECDRSTKNYVDLLRRVVATLSDVPHAGDEGALLHLGWRILSALEGHYGSGSDDEKPPLDVPEAVLDFADHAMQNSNRIRGGERENAGLSAAHTLSILRALGTMREDSIPAASRTRLDTRIDPIATNFLVSSDPTTFTAGLKCLQALEPALWVEKGQNQGGTSAWGAETWMRILGGLEAKDETTRKETIRLLQRVDSSLVEKHWGRLIQDAEAAGAESSMSHGSPPSTSASSTSSRPRQPSRHPQLSFILNRLLEVSAVVDTTAASWLSRIGKLIDLMTNLSDPEDEERARAVVLTRTIDRFRYSSADLQRGFVDGLMAGLKSVKEKYSMLEDLLLAGTMGAVPPASESEEMEAQVMNLAEKILVHVMSAAPTVTTEPLALAILRLCSHLRPSINLSSSLSALLERPVLASGSDTFRLFLRCLTSTAGRQALDRAGKRTTRSDTLPDFVERLNEELATPMDGIPATQLSRPSSSTSPARARGLDSNATGLRYEPYSSPSSNSATSSSQSRAAPSPAPNANVKASSLKRDWEADRERAIRGGRGGIGQSILGAGELALLGIGEQQGQRDGERNVDDDTSDRGSGEDGDELERRTPMQRSPIDMSAATSLSSRDVSTDRREAASPPADLLVDLNLDPFDTTEGE